MTAKYDVRRLEKNRFCPVRLEIREPLERMVDESDYDVVFRKRTTQVLECAHANLQSTVVRRAPVCQQSRVYRQNSNAELADRQVKSRVEFVLVEPGTVASKVSNTLSIFGLSSF